MLANNKLEQIESPPLSFILRLVRAFCRRQVTRKYLSEIPLTESASVVDVGCSAGDTTRRIAAVVSRGKVVGIDSSERKVRRAIRRCSGLPNVEFHVGGPEALPWEGDSFDCVTCLDSFHQCHNPGIALTEMLRVLKPGGKLFLGVRHYFGKNGVEKRRRFLKHSRTPFYRPGEYVRYFEQAGFLNVWQKMEYEYLLTVGTKG